MRDLDRKEWMQRAKRGSLLWRRGLQGGGGVLPRSGFLLESLFRCQSPEGIRSSAGCHLFPPLSRLPLFPPIRLPFNWVISAALVSALQHIYPSQFKCFCESYHIYNSNWNNINTCFFCCICKRTRKEPLFVLLWCKGWRVWELHGWQYNIITDSIQFFKRNIKKRTNIRGQLLLDGPKRPPMDQ